MELRFEQDVSLIEQVETSSVLGWLAPILFFTNFVRNALCVYLHLRRTFKDTAGTHVLLAFVHARVVWIVVGVVGD